MVPDRIGPRPMIGMSRTTGAAISGDEHLAQSIGDIITTPLGSRLMRRDYGCLLFELIDRPANRATLLLATVAIAMALGRWEPRISVNRVEFSGDLASGQAEVTITGKRTDQATNAFTRLTIPLSR